MLGKKTSNRGQNPLVWPVPHTKCQQLFKFCSCVLFCSEVSVCQQFLCQILLEDEKVRETWPGK